MHNQEHSDIPDATMFLNTVQGAQTVWVRVVDANTGCFSVTTLTYEYYQTHHQVKIQSDIELCDYDTHQMV